MCVSVSLVVIISTPKGAASSIIRVSLYRALGAQKSLVFFPLSATGGYAMSYMLGFCFKLFLKISCLDSKLSLRIVLIFRLGKFVEVMILSLLDYTFDRLES